MASRNRMDCITLQRFDPWRKHSYYDKTKEVANFKVKSEKLTEKIETLTFNISDIADDSKTAKVQLAWENTSVKFTIGVELMTV